MNTVLAALRAWIQQGTPAESREAFLLLDKQALRIQLTITQRGRMGVFENQFGAEVAFDLRELDLGVISELDVRYQLEWLTREIVRQVDRMSGADEPIHVEEHA